MEWRLEKRPDMERNLQRKMEFILASASPRRRELLEQIGLSFKIIPGNMEEKTAYNEPAEIVTTLAKGKASEVYESLSGKEQAASLVIGADTIVVHNGCVMGKPKDENDAVRMLTELCGTVHQVYTGVAFLSQEKGQKKMHTFYECTDVSVYSASQEEILSYVKSGDSLDKAGAYGIQGQFAAFIKKIDGDYNNVVGLPVGRVYQELKAEGFL